MTISNGNVSISVAEHGGELVSLKKNGHEYLWSGDARFWSRQAPILFPAVGKPFNNEIHVGGKSFPIKQHGFARDSEFEVVGNGCMRMKESTFGANYPYRLALEVCYSIEGSTVKAVWTVENIDNKDAFFQIGAHPGFLLPDYEATDDVHGYIQYYSHDGRPKQPVAVSSLNDGNRVPLATPRNIMSEMPLRNDTFAQDALMFEGGQVAMAVLCDKKKDRLLGVCCPQAEAFGVWAPHKEGCPFVCLEPWCGICDLYGFVGDISTRQYIHRLLPHEEYMFAYTIIIY